MKYTQKKPCHECPYVGNMPGFIGGHDHPEDFHIAVQADIPFPCHVSSISKKISTTEAVKDDSPVQHCVGYMLYMNRMCKRSRRPECGQRQKEIDDLNHLVLNPFTKEVITLHLAGPSAKKSARVE